MVAIIEKRGEKRIKIDLPIRISYRDNQEVSGKTENISRLGTYCEIDKEIPVGTDINIALEIPIYSEDIASSGKLRCKGRIFRCNLIRESDLYGIGIFFVIFPKRDDFDKLSRYIDFLILKQDTNINQAITQWKDKRDAARLAKQRKKLRKRGKK
jgi:hypothetical protein